MKFDRITRNSDVMEGQPCIRGTQVTVDTIVDQIRAGARMDEILKEYPNVQREDIQQALRYAVWRAKGNDENAQTISILATKPGEAPRCSWCDKPQCDIALLIATPTGRPRAYICDECVAVCNWLIEERDTNPQSEQTEPPGAPPLTNP